VRERTGGYSFPVDRLLSLPTKRADPKQYPITAWNVRPMNEKESRQTNRRALLEALYTSTEADVRMFVAAFELGTELRMDPVETGRALAYLEEKGLLLVDDYKSGMTRITAAGIDAVEGG
jgi:hypothetical protein